MNHISIGTLGSSAQISDSKNVYMNTIQGDSVARGPKLLST